MGLMYVVAITVGLLVIWPYAKWKDFTDDQMEKIVIWAVPAGLIGARLYYVVQQPLGYIPSRPFTYLRSMGRGDGFLRCYFRGGTGIADSRWRMKLSILSLLDIGGLFAIVGQFFGRIGNIINGDILGYPTKLPWGFVYANPDSFAPRHDIAYQPAAVYEALINIYIVQYSLLDSEENKTRQYYSLFISSVIFESDWCVFR